MKKTELKNRGNVSLLLKKANEKFRCYLRSDTKYKNSVLIVNPALQDIPKIERRFKK